MESPGALSAWSSVECPLYPLGAGESCQSFIQRYVEAHDKPIGEAVTSNKQPLTCLDNKRKEQECATPGLSSSSSSSSGDDGGMTMSIADRLGTMALYDSMFQIMLESMTAMGETMAALNRVKKTVIQQVQQLHAAGIDVDARHPTDVSRVCNPVTPHGCLVENFKAYEEAQQYFTAVVATVEELSNEMYEFGVIKTPLDEDLLKKLEKNGIEFGWFEIHVGSQLEAAKHYQKKLALWLEDAAAHRSTDHNDEDAAADKGPMSSNIASAQVVEGESK
jgi:hypothetical protein